MVIAREVQDYTSSRDKIYVRAPKESFKSPAWELTILMPRIENATEVARQAISDERTTCVLLSTELVYHTAQESDRTFNPKYVEAIKSAQKITLMANDSMWLCFGMSITQNDVRAGELATKPPGPSDGWRLKVGTLEEWMHEQTVSFAKETKLTEADMKADIHSGGLLY